MSFEGYFQLICKKGHYYTEGLWGAEEKALCYNCGSQPAWWNLVDTTNGDVDDEGNIISGYIKLEQEKEIRCDKCNSCLEVTYKIPDEGGHKC
jgi:hypothetical protein